MHRLQRAYNWYKSTGKALEKAGFPTLILNGDGADRSNTSDGQVLTRLDAFIEMLEDMKK